MQPMEEYTKLQTAYDWFNERLFGGSLPAVLITLVNKSKHNLGYFSPDKFNNRSSDTKTDELALNPANFAWRSDEQILSTLVHEQAHVWQQRYGTPSRNGYHNKEWGAKMDAIGLTPSNTGAVGGKRTGQQMDHFIVADGPFDLAVKELFASGYVLSWQSNHNPKKATKVSKVKYTCPSCEQKAWAKPGSSLICGECEETMLSEDQTNAD